MKKVINLIDDVNPGGIRSLLDDMSASDLLADTDWVVKAVKSERPIRLGGSFDSIVVHYSMAWRKLPALIALRLANPRAKLVIVEHHYTKQFEATHVPGKTRFRALLRTCYSLADKVVSVSNAQSEWLKSIEVTNTDKLQTIPACRNYARFFECQERDSSSGRMIIGGLGRVEADKGFDVLIKAVATLPATHFTLRIAGSGSEFDPLQAMASGLDNVELIGHVDDPASFLAECDVLVVPSRSEAFGLVCSEGKASGLPVIVSDTGGLPEQAAKGGIVVPSGDVQALRNAIRYVNTPHRRRRLGRIARRSVVDAWPNFLESWSELLSLTAKGEQHV